MAGKGGGGAWKVAYADFVTAMMAFFLVMWLTSQNQEIKSSVANYFSDPISSTAKGFSKTPTGAAEDRHRTGTVPQEHKVAMGMGRRTLTTARAYGAATKLVHDWLHEDKQARRYWQKQVRDQMESARWSKEVKEKRSSVKEVATRKLATQLQEELTREAPATKTGPYRSLLLDVFAEVNWDEIAEDLMTE